MHLPPRLHLVLASRRTPPLRIARLRAAGEVARIGERRPRHRRRRPRRPRRRTSERDVDAIAAATGGWPLAVQLAAEIRRGGPLDRATIVDRLLDPDAVLFEYLAEEVLAAASDGEREVVALAAHLPFVDAPLLTWPRPSRPRPAAAAARRERRRSSSATRRPADRYRATLVGGEFARRALPAPPAELVRRVAHPAVRARAGRARRWRRACASAIPTLARAGRARRRRDPICSGPRPRRGDRAGRRRPATTARLAELRGDLHYLRGSWDDAVAAYAEAARLGDPTVDPPGPQAGRRSSTCAVGSTRPTPRAPRPASTAATRPRSPRCCRGGRRSAGCAATSRAAAGSSTPALALGRAAGDDAALATAHTTRAMLAALRGRPPRERRRLPASRCATPSGPATSSRSCASTPTAAATTWRRATTTQALRELDAAIELAELIGSDNFGALAYSNRGDTYLRHGPPRRRPRRPAAGRGDLAAARIGHRRTTPIGLLGDVQALRGQRSEAIALYRQAIDLADAQRRHAGAGAGADRAGPDARRRRPDRRRWRPPSGRSAPPARCRWPHAHLAAGWIELRRGDRRRPPPQRGRERCTVRPGPPGPPGGRRGAAAPGVDQRAAGRRARRGVAAPVPTTSATASARPAPRSPLAAHAARPARDAADRRRPSSCSSRPARGACSPRPATPRPATASAPPSPSSRSAGSGSAATAGRSRSASGARARPATSSSCSSPGAGAPVVREEVAALLWPDEPDRSARRLSVLLSTIRGVLDPDKASPPDHFVAADHDTVWLVREHVDIDVELFLREAADGRRLLAAGDVAAGERRADAGRGAVPRRLLRRRPVRRLGGRHARAGPAHVRRGRRRAGPPGRRPRPSTARRCATGCGSSTSTPTTRTPTSTSSARSASQRRHGEARRAYRTYCTRLAELDLEPAPFP